MFLLPSFFFFLPNIICNTRTSDKRKLINRQLLNLTQSRKKTQSDTYAVLISSWSKSLPLDFNRGTNYSAKIGALNDAEETLAARKIGWDPTRGPLPLLMPARVITTKTLRGKLMEDNGPLRHLGAVVNWFANKKLFLGSARPSVIHFSTLMDTYKLFVTRPLSNERGKRRRKEI